MDIGSVGQAGPGRRPPEVPGRPGVAPGQSAKAVVAEAFASAASIPANAQGIAASSLARDVDAATVFAALTASATGECDTSLCSGGGPGDTLDEEGMSASSRRS